MDEILHAREVRLYRVKEWLNHFQKPIIVVKSNTPGRDKNMKEAYHLVSLYEKELQAARIISQAYFYESSDGPYAVGIVESIEANQAKKTCMEIEESTGFGRLVDLDVYQSPHSSISRTDLGYPSRPCLLCERPSHECSRAQRHSSSAIQEEYLRIYHHELHCRILEIINQSIDIELQLDNKYGLVTPTSSGSHPDMTYDLMIRAKDAILPGFMILFDLGYQAKEITSSWKEAQKVGVKMEQDMFLATKGVNAYKGLIFLLGGLVVAAGYALSHRLPFSHSFDLCAKLVAPAREAFDDMPSTFGVKAYQRHHLMGVRGEALNGFSTVRHILSSSYPLDCLDESSIRRRLFHLMQCCDDTTLLKRTRSYEKYEEVRRHLQTISLDDEEAMEEFHHLALANEWTFGGAADLLIVSIWAEQMMKFWPSTPYLTI